MNVRTIAPDTAKGAPPARFDAKFIEEHQLIERYRARHDLPLSSPRLAQLDLAYHDVRRSSGLYYQLQRSGAGERVVRDIDIFEAKTIPPILGRAA